MARYGQDHKASTRRRMIEASGRRFKRDGFDGAGIAALVADAGLTNGAFYGHFDSKDHLISTVVAEQLSAQASVVEGLPTGSVAAYVAAYLSPEHRDDPAGGCPSAALLDEVVRQADDTRRAYTDGARRLVDAIARHLDHGDPADARERALGLYTLLVSSLQLARAVTDPDLSEEILAAARANAARIVGQPPVPPAKQELP